VDSIFFAKGSPVCPRQVFNKRLDFFNTLDGKTTSPPPWIVSNGEVRPICFPVSLRLHLFIAGLSIFSPATSSFSCHRFFGPSGRSRPYYSLTEEPGPPPLPPGPRLQRAAPVLQATRSYLEPGRLHLLQLNRTLGSLIPLYPPLTTNGRQVLAPLPFLALFSSTFFLNRPFRTLPSRIHSPPSPPKSQLSRSMRPTCLPPLFGFRPTWGGFNRPRTFSPLFSPHLRPFIQMVRLASHTFLLATPMISICEGGASSNVPNLLPPAPCPSFYSKGFTWSDWPHARHEGSPSNPTCGSTPSSLLTNWVFRFSPLVLPWGFRRNFISVASVE